MWRQGSIVAATGGRVSQWVDPSWVADVRVTLVIAAITTQRGEEEISPSTLFAVASVLEGCSYINGSPQNTFVPGVVELAERKGVYIGGDDFKSGQVGGCICVRTSGLVF